MYKPGIALNSLDTEVKIFPLNSTEEPWILVCFGREQPYINVPLTMPFVHMQTLWLLRYH